MQEMGPGPLRGMSLELCFLAVVLGICFVMAKATRKREARTQSINTPRTAKVCGHALDQDVSFVSSSDEDDKYCTNCQVKHAFPCPQCQEMIGLGDNIALHPVPEGALLEGLKLYQMHPPLSITCASACRGDTDLIVEWEIQRKELNSGEDAQPAIVPA